MKRFMKKLIVPLVVVAILVASFWYDGYRNRPQTGDGSGLSSELTQNDSENSVPSVTGTESTPTPMLTDSQSQEPSKAPDTENTPSPDITEELVPSPTAKPDEETKVTISPTEIVKPTESVKPTEVVKPTETIKPTVEPTKAPTATQTPTITPTSSVQENYDGYCYVSIDCSKAVVNKNLSLALKNVLPKDGKVLAKTRVGFKNGETVFDVLKRVTKDQKINLEFSITPAYNSAYIEGIADLYEFDCGNLSGWMYMVNGDYLNIGCSEVKVKNDDVITWRYTCDLGKDLK